MSSWHFSFFFTWHCIYLKFDSSLLRARLLLCFVRKWDPVDPVVHADDQLLHAWNRQRINCAHRYFMCSIVQTFSLHTKGITYSWCISALHTFREFKVSDDLETVKQGMRPLWISSAKKHSVNLLRWEGRSWYRPKICVNWHIWEPGLRRLDSRSRRSAKQKHAVIMEKFSRGCHRKASKPLAGV